MALDTLIFRKNKVDPQVVSGLSGQVKLYIDWDSGHIVSADANGGYSIPLKDIFMGNAFQPYDQMESIHLVNRSIYFGMDVVDIEVRNDESSAFQERYLIAYGGTKAQVNDLLYQWLTSGPQIRTLYGDDVQFLCGINPKATGVKIKIYGWYKQNGQYSRTSLRDYWHLPNDGSINNHDLEITAGIRKGKIAETFVQLDIEAVDFYYAVDTATQLICKPIRFILKPAIPGVTTFAFRNGMGFLDSICSTGTLTDKPEYETRTFLSEGLEKELSTTTQRWIEVNTGRIDSEALRCHWMDFFESEERYVVHGDAISRIVVSDIHCEQQRLRYGTATFKYKLAEPALHAPITGTLSNYGHVDVGPDVLLPETVDTHIHATNP
ncbi:MAG: hypothetical protein IJQ93_05600 [Bacteroidales bacterium]|nr:hypothetical protein [Bacteroidales bacterium]